MHKEGALVLDILYNTHEFLQALALTSVPRKQRKKKHDKRWYYMDYATFDIETTNVPELKQSFMYIWQFHFQGMTVIGRTWQEFRFLIETLKERIKANFTIYVHNLSFEGQFLLGLWQFDELFAVDRRKILRMALGAPDGPQIEFRCSYLYTHMSLAQFSKKYGQGHVKRSGEAFDYSKRRYPDTELTEQELDYCTEDVICLYYSLQKYMEVNGVNVMTTPLTSTGFVRVDVKKLTRFAKLGELYGPLKPTPDTYEMLREAFWGGNAHANRYFVDRTIEDVQSFDRSSSYPHVQVCDEFPIAPFEDRDPAQFQFYIDHKRPVLARLTLTNVRLKDEFEPIPYICYSKTRNTKNYQKENGRILEAESLEITVTDIDYEIIDRMYAYDSMTCTKLKTSKYGKLPRPLTDYIKHLYDDKTKLKGVPEQEYFYARQKELLNSVYGLSAQDPVKDDVTYIGTPEAGEWGLIPADTEGALDKFYRYPYNTYAFGVWTTAHARKWLQRGIDAAHDDVIYCDTDSVKFIGDHAADFGALNREMMESGRTYTAYDPQGEAHTMGLFELDGVYKQFRTMGAKRYAYIDQKDELHITISGVNKHAGAAWLAKNGGIDAMKEGVCFPGGGGQAAYFTDKNTGWTEIDGHRIYLIKNTYLEDVDYTLTMTPEYTDIITKAAYMFDNRQYHYMK